MDTGDGHFKMLEEETARKLRKASSNRPVDFYRGLFYEGEELVIRGSRFRVQSIRPKKMILRLLKRTEEKTEGNR